MTDAEYKAQMAELNRQWQNVRKEAKRRREKSIYENVSEFDRAMYREEQGRKEGRRRAGNSGKK